MSTNKKQEKKTVSGRKPLTEKQRRGWVKVFLNQSELQQLQERMGDTTMRQSQYIRHVLLEDAKSASHINPVQFLDEVSQLASQVNKLGNNINQLAKYAHQLELNNRVEPHIIEALNEQLQEYAKLQLIIENKLRELLFT